MEDAERFKSLKVLPAGKKIYFASDFHLGAPDTESSKSREKRIIEWLEQSKKNASAFFLVGDVFDFWFEYSRVIPKGFIRFQGKLAEIVDSGIPVYLFAGNHDLWFRDYFPKELNIPIQNEPISIEINGRTFYIGHGDGLGKGEKTFKLIKAVFQSKLAQLLFRWLHPDLGIAVANSWSGKSRNGKHSKDDVNLGEAEKLFEYCKEVESTAHHDFYIFGHRHLPLEMKVAENSTYINLGEWFKSNSYLEFDGKKASLCYFN